MQSEKSKMNFEKHRIKKKGEAHPLLNELMQYRLRISELEKSLEEAHQKFASSQADLIKTRQQYNESTKKMKAGIIRCVTSLKNLKSYIDIFFEKFSRDIAALKEQDKQDVPPHPWPLVMDFNGLFSSPKSFISSAGEESLEPNASCPSLN